MQLYHYTHPSTYLFAAREGLLPNCKEDTAFMTGGVSVVWLTKEVSNLATAASIEEVVKLCNGKTFDRKVGQPMYGDSARLMAYLERSDKKLMRYADFLRKAGSAAALKMLPLAARTSWWVYRGTIPPQKVDVDVATCRACLDWHIETHPNVEARAQFRSTREAIEHLSPDERISLDIVTA